MQEFLQTHLQKCISRSKFLTQIRRFYLGLRNSEILPETFSEIIAWISPQGIFSNYSTKSGFFSAIYLKTPLENPQEILLEVSSDTSLEFALDFVEPSFGDSFRSVFPKIVCRSYSGINCSTFFEELLKSFILLLTGIFQFFPILFLKFL